MAWLQSSSADVSRSLSVDENSLVISNTNKEVSWIYDYLELKALNGRFFEDRKGKQSKECVEPCNIKPCNYSTTLSALRKATSNFIKHLDKSHKIVGPWKRHEEPLQTRLNISQEGPALTSNAKQREEALVRWIVKKCRPLQEVEDEAFQMNFRCIGYEVPINSARTIGRRIDEYFDAYMIQLSDHLNQSCQAISLSLDGWTSTSNISFLAIFGHWITRDFLVETWLLSFRELDRPHTSENLLFCVTECLEKFNIKDKFIAIVADNASNNERLVGILRQALVLSDSNGQINFKLKALCNVSHILSI